MTRALTAAELLSVWERGRGLAIPARALLLAAAADAPLESVAALSVGRRDGLLLALRARLFGARLLSVTACPQCARELEVDFAVAEICVSVAETPPEPLLVEAAGYEACFRLPNGGDLTIVADRSAIRRDAQPRAAAVGAALLARCLLWVRRAGCEELIKEWDELPPALIAAIAARMERADPQANVQLDLSCADCGHHWLASFDIVAHLWSELDDWARRTLREVHLLAAAYGWREADILTLSAQRRQLYLEMIGKAV